MAIEIRFQTANSMALTEKCRDVADFTRAVRSRKAEDLARHLEKCPACRKVALDSLSALVSDGDPWEPPAPLKKAAKAILRGLESETKVAVLFLEEGRIVKIAGLPGSINERTGGAQLEFTEAAEPFRVQVEVELGVVIIKAEPGDRKTDAVATLKSMGKSCEKDPTPRRLATGAVWTGLPPGKYLLTTAGKRGSYSIILDFRRAESGNKPVFKQ